MTTKTLKLHAAKREILGKKVKRLRAKQALPAVVYGHGMDSAPITIDLKEFQKVYAEAGTSALVDLAIDEEKPLKVLIHEPQPHYLNGQPIHADFYAVKMTEKIETAIPINFVGTSPAVEDMEGNFIENKDELNIRCLPGDLIPSVDVDISVLKTFDDQVRVKDINLPETVEATDDAEDVVCLVEAPRSEEELEAELAEDTAAEEAAVAELGKDDDTESDASEKSEDSSDGGDVEQVQGEQPKSG